MSDSSVVMVAMDKCDWSHRQGVMNRTYRNFVNSCEVPHMRGKSFPIEHVQRSVRRLMAETGAKSKPLAMKLGLGQTAIRDLLSPKAKSVSAPTMAAISNHFGVTHEALLDGTASTLILDEPQGFPVDDGETVEVTQLDLSFSMGPGTNIDDYIEETAVRFDLDYIRAFTRTPPHRLRIARGVGESMWPTLASSDMVWIDTTQTMLNQQDRIWAISLYGAAAIKRLRMIGDGKVMVISDNPAVDNQVVDAEDLRIGGRIIRFARDL